MGNNQIERAVARVLPGLPGLVGMAGENTLPSSFFMEKKITLSGEAGSPPRKELRAAKAAPGFYLGARKIPKKKFRQLVFAPGSTSTGLAVWKQAGRTRRLQEKLQRVLDEETRHTAWLELEQRIENARPEWCAEFASLIGCI